MNCTKEDALLEKDRKHVDRTWHDGAIAPSEGDVATADGESYTKLETVSKKIPANLKFVEIELPDKLKYKSKKRALSPTISYDIVEEWVTVRDQYGIHSGKIRLTIPFTDEETLMKFEVTQNLITESVMTQDFMMSYISSNARSSSCIADCHAQFVKDGNKTKGYGGCKFGCWMETAAKVLSAAAPILVAIIIM